MDGISFLSLIFQFESIISLFPTNLPSLSNCPCWRAPVLCSGSELLVCTLLVLQFESLSSHSGCLCALAALLCVLAERMFTDFCSLSRIVVKLDIPHSGAYYDRFTKWENEYGWVMTSRAPGHQSLLGPPTPQACTTRTARSNTQSNHPVFTWP